MKGTGSSLASQITESGWKINKELFKMEKMYVTLTGTNHYFGSDFLEPGMKVKLVKDLDNEYDNEAIMVKMKGLGKIGYVANSTYTVLGDSMSAGRIYDKFDEKIKAKVELVTEKGVILKISIKEKE